MTTPLTLKKATLLLEKVAAVRVATNARQNAARLRERLAGLRATLADLQSAQALFLACRATEGSGQLRAPDLGALTGAKEAFRLAQESGGDIDKAALALTGSLNAVRDALRAASADWWTKWAPVQVRDAGVEAIDLLEPADQERARRLVADLQKAAINLPKTPGDVSKFNYDLSAVAELVTASHVADLPVRVGELLRAVGRGQLKLSELALDDVVALQHFGYAEKLSIRWG